MLRKRPELRRTSVRCDLFRRCITDGCDHLAHCAVETDERGARNDIVADIKLLNLRNLRDPSDIAIGQSVAGGDFQSGARCHSRRVGDAPRFGLDLSHPSDRRVARLFIEMGIVRRADLDLIGPERRRRLDLSDIGVDEEADEDARGIQLLDRIFDLFALRNDVESALGGDLLRAFRDERDDVGFDARGDPNHLFGGRHLQVEMGDDHLFERDQIMVLNVTTIAAQMRRDPVGAGQFANHRRRYWVGFVGPPRLADCRNMIDVDVESTHSLAYGVRECRAAAGADLGSYFPVRSFQRMVAISVSTLSGVPMTWTFEPST
jgi:hypothetical protein